MVRVRYNVGEDWSGDPAIYFRVVLTNAAASEKRLANSADKVEKILWSARTLEDWGLFPHINVRSQSETIEMKDPEWE